MSEQNVKNYVPAPMDTSQVELPTELLELSEKIAKNVHEVWAQNRMEEGWVFGPVRNDAKRETPCLVPYEELPEIEKAYDRDTALGTLRFIVSLGYDIVKRR